MEQYGTRVRFCSREPITETISQEPILGKQFAACFARKPKPSGIIISDQLDHDHREPQKLRSLLFTSELNFASIHATMVRQRHRHHMLITLRKITCNLYRRSDHVF